MLDLIAELSLHTTWFMACCMWSTPNVLHMICTWLGSGHLSVRVGDSFSAQCEEGKKSQIAFSSVITIIMIIIIMMLKDVCCASRQWTSFLAAGSTAAYVYMYSFYYFFFKTK